MENRRVWAAMSPSTMSPVAGIHRDLARDEQQVAGTNRLGVRARSPWEPKRSKQPAASPLDASGGLDDLVRSQAARADAEPANAAVHHRADALQVRLEPTGRHVVGVADVAADDGALSADLAAFRHCCRSWWPIAGPFDELADEPAGRATVGAAVHACRYATRAKRGVHKRQIIAYPG